VTKKNKKSPLQGVGRIFFPDTDDETSRRFWGTYLPPPTPFEKTLFLDFGPKFKYTAPKFKYTAPKFKYMAPKFKCTAQKLKYVAPKFKYLTSNSNK